MTDLPGSVQGLSEATRSQLNDLLAELRYHAEEWGAGNGNAWLDRLTATEEKIAALLDRLTLSSSPSETRTADTVVHNAIDDPSYAPYCLRCSRMSRMQRVADFYWKCECGAKCDDRNAAIQELRRRLDNASANYRALVSYIGGIGPRPRFLPSRNEDIAGIASNLGWADASSPSPASEETRHRGWCQHLGLPSLPCNCATRSSEGDAALVRAHRFAWTFGAHLATCPLATDLNAPEEIRCTCEFDEQAEELMNDEDARGLNFWTIARRHTRAASVFPTPETPEPTKE